MNNSSIAPELTAALAQAGIVDLSPEIQSKLQAYCQLLWERNQVMNLTRHTTYEQFVFRDLLDSWHLARLLNQG